MAPILKQQGRIAELKTPLGKDKLAITCFDGSEGLSELFTFNIEALSETEDVDFDGALGAKCTVTVTSNDKTRHFNGVLVEAQWTGVGQNCYTYRLVLRPWLWLLSRVSDCRIFAGMTAPDILSEIFAKHRSFATVEKKLSGDYKKLEYYVQYRETDLDFVTRVMEEFGIYYFFKHEDGDHTLVLADAKSSHKPLPGGGKIPFHPDRASRRREAHLIHWAPERRFNTGRVVLNDYDYLKPSASLLSESESASGYQNSKLETFDYPGRYVEKSDGERYAKVRLEAEQASDNRSQGAGPVVSLFPGALMSLTDHPAGSSQNREYLVVRATHAVSTELYRSGSSNGGEDVYSGRYEFLRSDKPFRSPMLTPKPVVRGPQTAKVVGDGEIDVDEHGRIFVQFHWDRKKHKSRRVRIGQVWSGKNWGGIFIPRVGMEVIVEFLEGDPDQPLVVGTVYNKDYQPPYKLPDKKNIAGWKSNTTEGGGGYNELVFDDTKGKEKIRVHAEKDVETTIENDDKQTIKNNRTIKVQGKHHETIYGPVSIESCSSIELKVGESKITMTPASISISSPFIFADADAALMAMSPLTTISGSVMLTLLNNVMMRKPIILP